MSKTARTYITLITDPVTLVYPKFETPDVYVDPKTKVAGKPCYKTDAKDIEGGQAIAKAQAFVLAELVKLFPDMDPVTRRRTLPNGDTKTVHWPFKVAKDGVVTLTAKTARTNKAGELMRVPLFGANNKQLPESIYPGGGTVARLDLTLNAMPNDGGINFYINAVQVLKLQESSFGKSNFEPTDGYVYEAPEEPEEPKGNFADADEADATKF
jgi:hypothetical protein